jgi:hypothetical protein
MIYAISIMAILSAWLAWRSGRMWAWFAAAVLNAGAAYMTWGVEWG